MKVHLRIAIFSAVLALISSTAFAQAINGSIQGVVNDKEKNEPVAGATVVARSPALKSEQVAITDEKGFYAIADLPPGTYTITSLFAGTTAEVDNVQVVAGPAVTLNLALAASLAKGEEYVITGTRIPKANFESSSPMVTVSKETLKDTGSAAPEVALNQLPLFNVAQSPTQGTGNIQPTSTNTPGAGTLSLRGLGPNRNLVLIDGRRATPANAAGYVDIASVPFSAIERVEILTGGASSTYGADAVAGVTNFILRKRFEGTELDAKAGLTYLGDNFEYQVSGITGTNFAKDRGNVMLAMSVNQRNKADQKDRRWYQDFWANPDTTAAGFFSGLAGILFDDPTNMPTLNAGVDPSFDGAFPSPNPFLNGKPFFQTVYANLDGTPFSTVYNSGLVDNYNSGTIVNNQVWKLNSAGGLAFSDQYLYAVLPATRYNLLARSSYDVTDWLSIYGQAMYSHVNTNVVQEAAPFARGWSGLIPFNDALDLPPIFRAMLNARPNPSAPFKVQVLMPTPRATETDIDTYNMVAGLEGSIPGSDWKWDASVNHGMSSTFTNTTGVYSLERMRAVMAAPNWGQGFSQTGNSGAFAGFGGSTGTCTSGINPFRPWSEVTPDCFEAVKADIKNRSQMRQTIVEANMNGSLFSLPAGMIRTALGGDYRNSRFTFINDTLTTQGQSFLDQALGIYPSGNADRSLGVWELYGELFVPVLKDIPAIEQLNLELGARVSQYNATGTNFTFKTLADWSVTKWLRARGGFNRAERAPNLAELYLNPEQVFVFGAGGDPCSQVVPVAWSANPAMNPNAAQVEAVCRQQMRNAAGGSTNPETQYYGPGGGSAIALPFLFAFPTGIGNPDLNSETANTWTAGLVLQSFSSSPLLSGLSLSVDWWSIGVNGAIAREDLNTKYRQCYDPAFNPLVLTDPVAAANSDLCTVVPRAPDNGATDNVTITYKNDGRFYLQGLDTSLDWKWDIGPGTLGTTWMVNTLINVNSSPLPALPLQDFADTTGTNQNGLTPFSYRFKINASLGYGMKNWNVALQWRYLPSINDVSAASGPTPITGFPAYNLFNLVGNVSLFDMLTLRFGIENLFNQAPPVGGVNTAANPAGGQVPGGLIGTTDGPGSYDVIGTRFYLGGNLSF